MAQQQGGGPAPEGLLGQGCKPGLSASEPLSCSVKHDAPRAWRVARQTVGAQSSLVFSSLVSAPKEFLQAPTGGLASLSTAQVELKENLFL